MSHQHPKVSNLDLNIDFEDAKSGCILKAEADQLKDDLVEVIKETVNKTPGGDGCLWTGLVGDMLRGFKQMVMSAIMHSKERVSAGIKVSENASDPAFIAINHSTCGKLFKKLVDTVSSTIDQQATSKNCLSAEEVEALKEKVVATVAKPPHISPGEAMAKYRQFVESKYSNTLS